MARVTQFTRRHRGEDWHVTFVELARVDAEAVLEGKVVTMPNNQQPRSVLILGHYDSFHPDEETRAIERWADR